MPMTQGEHQVQASHLFTPVRTIGLVTDGVPVSVYKLGADGFVATTLRNTYQIMDINKMQINLRSPVLSNNIVAIHASKSHIYAAVEKTNEIFIFQRLDMRGVLKGHCQQIKGLFTLGSILISWSRLEVMVWDLDSLTLLGQLPTSKDEETGEIGSVLHPETYLNKIVIGYRHGSELQLWNIKTLKKIYSFRSVQPDVVDLNVGITSLGLSIHPNIIGVGYSNGLLRLLDVDKDEILSEFQHSLEQGAVCCMAFRSDAECLTPGAFITGCENGDIVVWDTRNSKLLHIIEAAHSIGESVESGVTSAVSQVVCIQGEPLMISSGKDNSIILWIFDGVEEKPRILRQRQGLPAPISKLEVYDESGKDILILGQFKTTCVFGKCSTIQQHQNCRFSQKKALKHICKTMRAPIKQLPPAIDLSFAFSRHYDWPNIVTCHERLSSVFIWSGHDKVLVPRTINLPYRSPITTTTQGVIKHHHDALPTALCVSGCGNFLVVGYNNGTLHKFHLQSGSYAQEFQLPNQQKAHEGPVSRVEILSSLEVLSASGAQGDANLKRWNLTTRKSEGIFPLGDVTFSSIQTFKTLGVLTAVVLKASERDQEEMEGDWDSSCNQIILNKLVLIDFQTKSVVREFPIQKDEIVAVTFSRDCRWLAITLRHRPHLLVYDILSTSLIDWIELPSTGLSITFDPSNAFLYVGLQHLSGGIFVMANKYIFDPTVSTPLLTAEPTQPIRIGDPIPENDVNNEGHSKENDDHDDLVENPDFFEPLEPGMLTLSGESEGRLQAIYHLEKIRDRNAAQQKKEMEHHEAPFFLPTMYSHQELQFVTPVPDAIEEITTQKKPPPLISSSSLSALQTFLRKSNNLAPPKKNELLFKEILFYFHTLSPSGINLALTELGTLSGGRDSELVEMIDFFIWCVASRREADFVQALLHVFLEVHSEALSELCVSKGNDIIMSSPKSNISTDDESVYSSATSLKTKLVRLRAYLKEDYIPLDLQCHQLECVIKFLTHTQIE